MNILDVKSKSQGLTEAPASLLNRRIDSPRLVVLLPEKDINYMAVVRRIWELANIHGAQIQFIGLCREADHEADIRRKLVMISAMAQDTVLHVETKVEFGNDWVKAVKSNWRDGDMLVCFKEHNAGRLRGPLSRIIETNLHAPVYLLSGMLKDEYVQPGWKSQLGSWLGSIGILVGFFFLDVWIKPQLDWVHQSLFFVSILVEVGVLWLWNIIF